MQNNWQDEASFSDFIISFLLSCGSTRIQRNILYELVQEKRKLNRQAFNNNLYRLKKKGILEYSSKDVVFNKNVLKQRILFSTIYTKPAGSTKIMVLFDIPENKRKIRNWLRLHLKLWEFEMIQQSVWLGKGPLPKEFTERLNAFGISKCVRVLKVQSIKS